MSYKSGSIKNIENTNSLLCGFLFNSVFFVHVFVKHKRDLRLKYILVAFVFLSSNFYLSTYDDIVCNRLQSSQFSILTISKLRAINNNRSFYRLILILSGDISLNPGLVYSHHPPNL